MRRLLRRSLLVLCAALPLAMAALWGISQRWEHHFSCSSPSSEAPGIRITRLEFAFCTGALRFAAGSLGANGDVRRQGVFRHDSFTPSANAWHRDLRLRVHGWESVRRFLGFGFMYRRQSGTPYDVDRPSVLIEAPYWFLMAVCSFPPALWLRRYGRRRVWKRRGLCVACGYDLRASPERCPECGTPVEQPLGPRPC